MRAKNVAGAALGPLAGTRLGWSATYTVGKRLGVAPRHRSPPPTVPRPCRQALARQPELRRRWLARAGERAEASDGVPRGPSSAHPWPRVLVPPPGLAETSQARHGRPGFAMAWNATARVDGGSSASHESSPQKRRFLAGPAGARGRHHGSSPRPLPVLLPGVVPVVSGRDVDGLE